LLAFLLLCCLQELKSQGALIEDLWGVDRKLV
jgi:hypothetical protein